MNIGIVKEITGNDEIYARPLYCEAQYIKILFKLALICNRLPKLSSEDQAIWNRIRVLSHESRFPKNLSEVPETLEEQERQKIFPRDPFFNEKLDGMKQAFMSLLFEEYLRFTSPGNKKNA